MSMPWDVYKPAPAPEPPPVVEPELPYVPPTPNLPERPTSEIDFGRILKDAFSQALREVNEHPSSKGSDLVRADARSRSWRTLVQGLGIDLMFAIVAVLATVAHVDPLDKAAWITLAGLLIKTVIQTLVAYVMRLRVTPTVRTKGEKMALMPLPMEVPSERQSPK